MADEDIDPEENKSLEITAQDVAPMFGSLLSVAQIPDEDRAVFTQDWWHIIGKWYPNMLTKIYCVPPVHFYAVTYKPKVDPQPQPEPYERFGMRMLLPSQYTSVVDDEAQQRVLRTLYAFAKEKGFIWFVLSNVEFQNYLNKNYTVPAGEQGPPKLLKSDDGEVDVIVIDKTHGIFLLEVKSTGYRHHVTLSDEEKIKDCKKPLQKVAKQLPKEKEIVRRILDDLDPGKKIKIRKGFLMPNLKREILDAALGEYSTMQEANLLKAVQANDLQQLSHCCLCADDMPPMNTADTTLTRENVQAIDRFWTTLQHITDEMEEPIADGIYQQLVARFCGHLSTVKIYTEKTMPRVRILVSGKKKKLASFECRTMAGAAREMATRFSELVLLPEQIDLLQAEEDFVHLEGPPGTGKTLMLLLRVLTWLDGNNMVWMLSLAPPSRSIIHVLHEQVKQMLHEHKGREAAEAIIKKRLRIFIMTRPEKTLDDKYFKRRLHKWRLRAKLKDSEINWGYPRRPTLPPVAPLSDRKVCLILDETGMTGKGLNAFFNQVAVCQKKKCFTSEKEDGFSAGLSVWSASVEKCGRPCYARDPNEAATPDKFGVYRELKIPLRCPPSVQRALMLVQPTLDEDNVFLFQRENVLPNPIPATHFQYHADGLPVYLIAHGGHKKPDKPIWLCRECGADLAGYLKDILQIGEAKAIVSDVPLCQKDVLIVGTQKSFIKSLPMGGFFHSLYKKKLNVAVSTTREEGDAGLPAKDVILVADITSVHGLERAVVIVVPEVPGSDTPMHAAQALEKMEMDDSQLAQQNDKTTGPITLTENPEVNDDDTDIEPDEEMFVSPDSSMTPVNKKLKTELVSSNSAASAVTSLKTNTAATPTAVTSRQIPADVSVASVAHQPTDSSRENPVYLDSRSESEIDAALNTLSDQARRDVFYIGSRAVCQLIIIHFGK